MSNGKRWVHRNNAKAKNLLIHQVTDAYQPGKVRVEFSYRTEGTKLIKVDDVEALLDIYQIVNLVEKSRRILDEQVQRLQQLRGRLG